VKLYPDKLPAELKKKIAPIYIVSGDEPLLVQETCDLIRSSLKKAGYTERELLHADAGFNWEQVSYSANSMSLFAEQKLLEIRMSSAKPGKDGIAALNAFAASPPDGTILMLVMPRLDQSTQKTKWFKTIEHSAAFVQIWPIELKDMPRWIDNRFKRAGLVATRDAVAAMVERVEGNLLAAVQEIERIKLVSEDGKVDARLIQQGVADSSRYDVFALLDAAVGGNPVRTLKVLGGLQLEGGEVLYIVAMLVRELRGLVLMANEFKATSLDSALRKGRIWAKRKNLVSNCLRSHSVGDFQDMLSRTATIDGMVKGVNSGNPWNELTSITLQLAGTRLLSRSN
jgi:DNA polymerase-3 subunit delta